MLKKPFKQLYESILAERPTIRGDRALLSLLEQFCISSQRLSEIQAAIATAGLDPELIKMEQTQQRLLLAQSRGLGIATSRSRYDASQSAAMSDYTDGEYSPIKLGLVK